MRDRTKLYPVLQEKINLLLAECKKQGLNIGISECVRTVDEQNQLYAKGRTLPGSIVTNAKGTSYSSMHQWGVAFDFYRNDGKGAYVDTDGFFTKVGKIGQSIGLEWGGSWKSPVDKPHFQLPDWGSTASKLKKQYGTPDKFMPTWVHATSYVETTNEMTVTKRNIKIVQLFVGSEPDGAWGTESKKCMVIKLQEIMGIRKTGNTSDDFYRRLPVLREWRHDSYVKCLEGLLFVHGYNPQDFSGLFNENVQECIRQLERDRGLTVDKGIAGHQVWKTLIG